ncbi:hypothetical protein GYH30_048369 [Glycine max]|uniref:Uncharacterized protein n=2 Tax=Glycine subgen. Soja TaxID=1462606 RepID=A0A0R0FRP0_SOYBN|nr:hypothetical protein GYH30_048369 [Glycine max]RZB58520.1 Protein OSB1, mitochondrial [Glycine soja]
MWHNVAELATEHLKATDFIHVSGSLGSFTKPDANGILQLNYKKILFSSNPNEWWDQRKRKRNPKQPDFKHKDTGEAQWLREYDPPWVKKQLQLFDSKIAGGSAGHHCSRVINWVYDE